MDMYKILEQLRRGARIEDLRLRVTFYARVSSEKDEQLNSLSNQISYYRDKIQKNKNWIFVDGYIDEGISGISTKKRENFNRMIDDAKAGVFDIIITKEISRFARNTLDSIKFTRELYCAGVAVIFENDGIRTYEPDSELRLTIMASIAQDELRKLSSRVKFGHKQAIKSQVVLGNSRIFGYKKHNKHLIIDESEAALVRELYELYATDEYSLKDIEKIFWEKGYRNHNGNKIMHNTMSGIISNPKYKGYYVGGKVIIVDMFTKKQKFLPQDEWVMYKDETGEIVPAIVSEELWEKANIILQRRSQDVKERRGICNHGNILTGKLFCTHCGLPYYRKDSRKNTGENESRWVCSGKIKNGKDSCPSLAILESDIRPILLDIFKDAENGIEQSISNFEAMFSEISTENNLQKIITSIETKISELQKKQDKLLELYSSAEISRRQFVDLNTKYESEIEALTKELSEYKSEFSSESEFNKRINEIRTILKNAKEDIELGAVNSRFINRYVDKILVSAQSPYAIRLEVKLFTGENCTKFIEKLQKSRTGPLSKKMVESYENSIKNQNK